MYAADVIEVLCAAHLTHYVASPHEDRGGIMLVGPPAVMKSTLLDVLDRQYHDAVSMSDVNAKALAVLREPISNGQIHTLVLPELLKLYERHEVTSANVEGILRAMVAEGFRAASFDDQRVNRFRARVMVVGALTTTLQSARYTAWEESGFNRRFLWAMFVLDRPQDLDIAAINNVRIPFYVPQTPQAPVNGSIPFLVTPEEKHELRYLVKYQPGGSHTQHIQLLGKILSVLRWWYHNVMPERDPMMTLRRFSEALGRDGGRLVLEQPPADPLPHRAVRSTKAAKKSAKKGRRRAR